MIASPSIMIRSHGCWFGPSFGPFLRRLGAFDHVSEDERCAAIRDGVEFLDRCPELVQDIVRHTMRALCMGNRVRSLGDIADVLALGERGYIDLVRATRRQPAQSLALLAIASGGGLDLLGKRAEQLAPHGMVETPSPSLTLTTALMVAADGSLRSTADVENRLLTVAQNEDRVEIALDALAPSMARWHLTAHRFARRSDRLQHPWWVRLSLGDGEYAMGWLPEVVEEGYLVDDHQRQHTISASTWRWLTSRHARALQAQAVAEVIAWKVAPAWWNPLGIEENIH